ncbi:MAG: hypothetical protein HPY74_09540 [Firmicutes bacterium]|nr:hypothetical protein [Bacillota bacterium]
MENILRKVIEIEYRAQRIMGEGAEERKQAVLEAEEKIALIKEEIFLSLKKSIEEIKAEKQKEAKQESERIMLETKNKVSLMQKEFNENRNLWVKDIFNDIIYGS